MMLDMHKYAFLKMYLLAQFWGAPLRRHRGCWRRDSRSEHSLPPRSSRPRRLAPGEDRTDRRVATDSQTFSCREIQPRSTWHAAGLTTLYHPTPNVKRVHWESLNFYTQITAETGQEVAYMKLKNTHRKELERVHWDSLNFYTKITAETGQEVCFILFIEVL